MTVLRKLSCGILSLALVACTIPLLPAAETEVVKLWPGDAPGSEAVTEEESVRTTEGGDHVVSKVHRPSLTVYLPTDNATGAAVVIAPGGGHRELWMDHEGYNVADWLRRHGVAAFVLKYRLARAQDSRYKIEEHSFHDAQRAIRLIRSRAAEWRIDPKRIGVMGFSAGGEIAALAAANHDSGDAASADAIERQPSRPAFQALIYPAIPANLKFSSETPPAFLVCGENDRQNISQGLPELYLAMKRAGASAELHVFAGVGHGFGLRDRLRGPVAGWLDRFHGWLGATGFLGPKE
jgi:endo-1,4-beta-xylanase